MNVGSGALWKNMLVQMQPLRRSSRVHGTVTWLVILVLTGKMNIGRIMLQMTLFALTSPLLVDLGMTPTVQLTLVKRMQRETTVRTGEMLSKTLGIPPVKLAVLVAEARIFEIL